MTRKSKRSLERDVEELKQDDGPPDLLVVYENPETGEWFDRDGLIINPSEVDPLVVLPETGALETDYDET